MSAFELISFSDSAALALAAAGSWLKEIEEANKTGKIYCVALSGGRITRGLFSAVVELSRVRNVVLGNVHFFWADERCVPPDDPESNFADARKLLFEPLNICETRIHRIRGEDKPSVAAEKAALDILQNAPRTSTGQPALDLIFLGMGEDGHVASLFPDGPEELISDNAVFRTVTNSPKPPPNRITLSYAAICAARKVWVLVSGAGKEVALRESLKPEGKSPLARVLQSRKDSHILTDVRL